MTSRRLTAVLLLHALSKWLNATTSMQQVSALAGVLT